MLTVLNPTGYPPKVTGKGLAPGLDRLDGARLFLVDVGFENSDNFMVQLQDVAGRARALGADRGRALARSAPAGSGALRADPLGG